MVVIMLWAKTLVMAMTQLLVVAITLAEAGYLYDQHAPAALPWAATARGGAGAVNPTAAPPPCGVKFGAGLLSRGVSSADLDSNTEFGEYPWHIGILAYDPDNPSLPRYVCGGALVDSRHVVTTAHCVKSLYPQEILVRVGEWDVNSNTELYPHVDMPVCDIFLHERFDSGSLRNDIAVIRMKYGVDFAKLPQVAPICLPRAPPPNSLRCWVTGWGKDAFLHQGDYQSILQEVDVPIVESRSCEYYLKRTALGDRFSMTPGWLCAGGEEGKDACSGDGGGPLTCGAENPDGAYLAGLVSWGVGCGKAMVPGVYTNIVHYVPWIKETMATP